MPINLRYDLWIRRDATLARRLEAAWQLVDRCSAGAIKPSWWDAFHANHMRRSYIRHRIMYRLKARAHGALKFASMAEGGLPFFAVLLAILVLTWLWPSKVQTSRSEGILAEEMGPYEAFLLKCEIEDLQDEIARRVAGRDVG